MLLFSYNHNIILISLKFKISFYPGADKHILNKTYSKIKFIYFLNQALDINLLLIKLYVYFKLFFTLFLIGFPWSNHTNIKLILFTEKVLILVYVLCL